MSDHFRSIKVIIAFVQLELKVAQPQKELMEVLPVMGRSKIFRVPLNRFGKRIHVCILALGKLQRKIFAKSAQNFTSFLGLRLTFDGR